MTALFEWIALEASPKLFHFMKGYINPKYIEKTYTLVNKDFFKNSDLMSKIGQGKSFF